MENALVLPPRVLSCLIGVICGFCRQLITQTLQHHDIHYFLAA